MKYLYLLLILSATLFPAYGQTTNYPSSWWQAIPRGSAESWEVLPQDAAQGEVILSKRTELGIFSHFAGTPFMLDGEVYASIEGLWQSLKYPDPTQPNDPRHLITEWPFTRTEVMNMVAFDAKDAGSKANAIYRRHGLTDISYQEHFFNYVDHATGSEFHYQLLKRAMRAKLNQNAGLWELLISTGDLRLRPDHNVDPNSPKAYHYYDMYMELRAEPISILFK